MRVKEEHAIVLDVLKNGYPEDSLPLHRREPIIQALGKEFFILFELIARPDVTINQLDEIYIGEGVRDKVKYIRGTLPFDRLTQTAKTELPFIIEKQVLSNEAKFVQFFNLAGPISLRAHSLELLPGVGRKHATQILEERKIKPFESFEDFKKRVTAVSSPVKVIVNRIMEELEGKDRHRIFVGA